tara:strand:- start:2100 stop:2498 length:399 start_codon:yes stop_codon:yes gene_type:complete
MLKMQKNVGIIIDNTFVTKQIRDLVQLSQEAKNYKITTLIINNNGNNSKSILKKSYSYISKKGISFFLSIVFFKFICKVEAFFLCKKDQFKYVFKRFNLSEEKFKLIILNPTISKSGLFYSYSNKDIQKIRD